MQGGGAGAVPVPVLVDVLRGVPGVSAFDKFVQVLSSKMAVPMAIWRPVEIRPPWLQILRNVGRLEGVLLRALFREGLSLRNVGQTAGVLLRVRVHRLCVKAW